ncbi:hypothetical protein [Ralstonia phage RP31]|uniref:Uncharacterized protein n=2 Tax=Ripduovirus RP12 TaxID=2560700 RepID=A0A1L7N0Z7_9CAUD|nr:hypothetical protein FDH28_gp243 [Ralstonia phage RP12]BAW19152.1 hypothetical protein [Ralstonia phage RP12]BAW19438.1 hypothetical protein [Ralstonia phage RP31]
MEYVYVINELQAILGAEARVVTRYNSPAKSEYEFSEGPSRTMRVRPTHFVVADHENVSYHLRAIQLRAEDGSCVLVDQAIEMLKSDTPTFEGKNSLQEALEHSGLDFKYHEALKHIVGVLEVRTGNDVRFGADSNPFNQAIALYVYQDGALVIFQFKE